MTILFHTSNSVHPIFFLSTIFQDINKIYIFPIRFFHDRNSFWKSNVSMQEFWFILIRLFIYRGYMYIWIIIILIILFCIYFSLRFLDLQRILDPWEDLYLTWYLILIPNLSFNRQVHLKPCLVNTFHLTFF